MTTQTHRTDWWRRSQAAVDHSPRGRASATRPSTPASSVPFWALMVFILIMFLAPQSFVPALASVRIALIAAILAIATHLLDRLTRGQPFTILPRELRIALGLAAWALLLIPMSLWPGGSVYFLLSIYLKILAVFWLLINVIATPARIVRVAWMLTLIAYPLALTAVQHFVTGDFIQADIEVERIVGYDGPFVKNPNDLALVLNLILPVTVALLLAERRVLARAVLTASVILAVLGVVVTFSRAGFLTLATIFVAYLLKLRHRRERWLVGLALVLVLLAAPFLPTRYLGRVDTITSIDSDSTGSAQARWRDMVAAATYILWHPFVGAGAGMDILALNEVRGEKWLAVHNIYLEYAVDLGIPGLAMFLLLLVGSLKCAGFVQRRTASVPAFRQLFYLGEGLQISLVAFAVAANFSPGGYNLPFYLFAGLAIALKNLYADEASRARVHTA